MRILMVEDSPRDRELLRYLLEERFSSDNSEILEAADLETAIQRMSEVVIDVVILDLSLPDSTGKETFQTVYARFPDVPFIVMTHNSDRELALTMIKEGASDYILKNYTDAEEIFRRIMFAVEKHRISIRVPAEAAASVHKVERTRAAMLTAHESGQHQSVPARAVETTSAVAELSRNMFTQMQEFSTTVARMATRQELMQKTVNGLDKELIRGHSGRPSVKSMVDTTATTVAGLEKRVGSLEEDRPSVADWQEITQAHAANETQIKTTKMNNRAKIFLGVLTLVGVLAGAYATYYAATQTNLSNIIKALTPASQ